MDIAFKMLTLGNVFKYYTLAVLCSGIRNFTYCLQHFYHSYLDFLLWPSQFVGQSLFVCRRVQWHFESMSNFCFSYTQTLGTAIATGA